jgi:hypothetical protein
MAESPATQSLQDEARMIYAELMDLLTDIRAKPHWKMEKDPNMKKKLERFVFKNHQS